MEIWKNIKGYEGLYQVSNLGNIKSLSKIVNNNGGKTYLQEKIMKTFDNKHGYKIIQLSKNNKRKTFSIHKLVANAFLNKNNFKYMPYEKLENININDLDINHKNENKIDNRVENLEWCTRSYNNNYGQKIENDIKSKGTKIEQYNLDRKHIKTWNSIRDVQRKIAINHNSIMMCLKGKYKQAGGYIWKYAK